MPTTPNKSDQWRAALKLINHCPICNGIYDAAQAKLFARVSAASLVHIICSKCSSNFVAMIVTMGAGMSSVGIVTDLNFADAARLYRAEPLTTDETIEGYKEIENKHFIQSLLLKETFV